MKRTTKANNNKNTYFIKLSKSIMFNCVYFIMAMFMITLDTVVTLRYLIILSHYYNVKPYYKKNTYLNC